MSNPLKTYREEKKMTQGELADMLGLKQQMISHYEKGMSPSLDIAKKILKMTGVNLMLQVQEEQPGEVEFLKKEIALKDMLIEQMGERISLMERLLKK